jgi:hypothetical protein
MTLTLTPLQREEIKHLWGNAMDEVETLSPHDETAEDYASRVFEVSAYQALLDGKAMTPDQIEVVIAEVEYHADKFAPMRATRFSPGNSGDRSTFSSLNSLLRKLRETISQVEQ